MSRIVSAITIIILTGLGFACQSDSKGSWETLYEEGLAASHAGDYELAKNLGTRALEMAESSGGANHPDVSASLDLLGRVHSAQGEYAKAVSLYSRSLAIDKRRPRQRHPADVATAMNNLATVYQEQGEYADAEPLFERAIDIWKETVVPIVSKLRRDSTIWRGSTPYKVSTTKLSRYIFGR